MGSSIFQMCPREDIDHQGLQLQDMKSDLETILAEVKSEIQFKFVEANRGLEEKLDAVLATLGKKEATQWMDGLIY